MEGKDGPQSTRARLALDLCDRPSPAPQPGKPAATGELVARAGRLGPRTRVAPHASPEDRRRRGELVARAARSGPVGLSLCSSVRRRSCSDKERSPGPCLGAGGRSLPPQPRPAESTWRRTVIAPPRTRARPFFVMKCGLSPHNVTKKAEVGLPGHFHCPLTPSLPVFWFPGPHPGRSGSVGPVPLTTHPVAAGFGFFGPLIQAEAGPGGCAPAAHSPPLPPVSSVCGRA